MLYKNEESEQINYVVEVNDVDIGYGSTVILKNISFKIKRGEIFIILGGSGCGKTTLLKHLIGLYKPFRGDILIKGRSIVTCNEREKRSIMRSFGVTYQYGALFGSLTIGENVALPLEEYTNFSKSEIQKIVKEKLSLVGLEQYIDYYPSEISGGMKKRAGLARAMALDADLLFFDEPSAGLDPISSAQLDKLILGLRKKLNTTMVIVTHELDSIFTISDRVIMLDKEQKGIVATGNVWNLYRKSDNPWVKEFLSRSGLGRERLAANQ